MDGVHEMAAELFTRIMAERAAKGTASQEAAADAARDSYAYARVFFDEHGRHIESGA
jgi:hypothetical protein